MRELTDTDLVDEASIESFPCSDPPSWTSVVAVGGPVHARLDVADETSPDVPSEQEPNPGDPGPQIPSPRTPGDPRDLEIPNVDEPSPAI